MIRIWIDKTDYTDYTTIGASFVQRLDEQLDEAQITLVWTNKLEPFVPVTPMGFYDDNDLIAGFIVANDNVTVDTKDPLTYRHELSLIEPTKYLERFKIDGKTFTQPRNENSGYAPYTLLDVVKQLRNVVPLRVSNELDFSEVPISNNLFKIPSYIATVLDSIEAPEFNFKDKTLREALDQVAFEINANVFMNLKMELMLNYFNEQKNQINKDFVERTMDRDISQYSTNMISSVMNAVSQDEGNGIGVSHSPGDGYYSTTRTDTTLWNYEDSKIRTTYPIYDVLGVNFIGGLRYIPEEYTDTGWGATANPPLTYENLVVREAVVEEQKKATLDIAENATELTQNPNKLFANGVMSYTYGRKDITVPAIVGTLFTRESIFYALFEGLVNKVEDNNFSQISDVNDYNVTYTDSETNVILTSKTNPNFRYRIEFVEPNKTQIENNELSLSVEYKPVKPTVRMNLEVSGVSETPYKSYITGNQQMRIVDIERYANKQQARVDRLGLSELTLGDVIKDISQLLNLGDFTTDGYIITQREIVFYKDHLEVLYMLNKDFNKLNQFTGVDSQVRQWEIAEAGRTVERNLNYDEYVELSFGGVGTNESKTLNEKGKDKILSTFDKSPINRLGTNLFLIRGKYPTTISDVEVQNPWAIVPFVSYQGGNSVALNASIDDNASTGNYIEDISSAWHAFWGSGKFFQRPLLYVGTNVRVEDIDFIFSDFDLEKNVADGSISPSTLLETSNRVPYYDGYPFEEHIGGNLQVYKDNREKLSFMFAYHLVSNEQDLIIGQGFSKRNNLISNQPNSDLEVRFFDRRFTKRDTMGVGNGIGVDANALSVSYFDNTLSISTINAPTGAISYAVTTSNGLPLLLVQDIEKTLIRLDFRRFRTGVSFGWLESNNLFGTASDSTNVSYESSLHTGDIFVNEDEVVNTSSNIIYTVHFATSTGDSTNSSNTSQVNTLGVAADESFTIQTSTSVNYTTLEPATSWNYIGTSANQDDSVQAGSDGSTCRSSSEIDTWLETNVSASNYNVGFIMRVDHARLVDGSLEPCQSYYYEAI